MSDPFNNQTQLSSGGLPITYIPGNYAADGAPVTNQWKDPVSVHTDTAITLAGLQVIDSIQLKEGDRVLVKDQTLQHENGIYTVSAGPWQRARDMYLWKQFPGAVVSVSEGASVGDTLFLCFAPQDGTLGETAISWISVSTQSTSTGTITPLRAYASDAAGNPIASPTTAQELAYVNGVTSPLQAQITGVAAAAGSAFSIAVAGTNAAATAQSTANSAYSIAVTGTTIGSLAYNYALALGDKYVRTTRFAQISSGTSGTVTLPANSTVVLDDFGGTTDAVIAGIAGGFPTENHVFTEDGAMVTTAFDSSGNYTLSAAPAAYPVAIVYRVRQRFSQFDSTSSDILGGYDIEQVERYTVAVATAGLTAVSPDGSPVYLADSTSGAVTLALPHTQGLSGFLATVKKISRDANSVTVSSITGTQTIDGSTSQVIYTQYTSISVTTDGTNWYII